MLFEGIIEAPPDSRRGFNDVLTCVFFSCSGLRLSRTSSILHKNKRVVQQTSDDPPFGGFPYIFSLTTRSMYAFCASVSVGNGFRQPPQSTPCVLRMCLMDGNSEQETSACMMLFARF